MGASYRRRQPASHGKVISQSVMDQRLTIAVLPPPIVAAWRIYPFGVSPPAQGSGSHPPPGWFGWRVRAGELPVRVGGRCDESAHRRVADVVPAVLQVPGVAVPELRVALDGDEEVVPAAGGRQ